MSAEESTQDHISYYNKMSVDFDSAESGPNPALAEAEKAAASANKGYNSAATLVQQVIDVLKAQGDMITIGLSQSQFGKLALEGAHRQTVTKNQKGDPDITEVEGHWSSGASNASAAKQKFSQVSENRGDLMKRLTDMMEDLKADATKLGAAEKATQDARADTKKATSGLNSWVSRMRSKTSG